MAWLEITVNTAPGTIDDAVEKLTAAGFSDLVVEDQGEFESFLEENRACWDYIDQALQEKLQGLSRVRLYLEDTDRENLARIQTLTDRWGLSMTAVPLADNDWDQSWKDNYPPVEVGEGLVVLPCWLAESDCRGRKPVILDPGLTFGTGAHPSTQMVMEAMETTVKAGDRCLDLGSGSGILSITALRLGADSAVGVDIDPKAEDMARENAGFNGFTAPRFTALTGSVTDDPRLMASLGSGYDLVLVNIVADVIIRLAPALPGFLGEGGTVICSGILDVRLPEVTAALEKAGLSVTSTREREDWRCVTAVRR